MTILREIHKRERLGNTTKAPHFGRGENRSRSVQARDRLQPTRQALYDSADAGEDGALFGPLDSLEDPFEDWAESMSEADEWLRNHGVRADEERET